MGINRDLANLAFKLGSNAFAAQQKAVRDYAALCRRMAAGQTGSDTSAVSSIVAIQCDESVAWMRDWTTLNLRYWKDAADLVAAQNERFAQRVLNPLARVRPTSQTASVTAGESQCRRVEVEVRATVGDHVGQTFLLENHQPRPAEVSFLVSEFTGPSRTAFRAPVSFLPERFVLAAGEERRVTLRLFVAQELFRAGESYAATVLVRGYRNLEMTLRIHTIAPASQPMQTLESEPALSVTRTRSTPDNSASVTSGKAKPKQAVKKKQSVTRKRRSEGAVDGG